MKIGIETALVTGASSGIGAELALGLARLGVRVGITARRVDRLETLARSIREAGGFVAVAPADAADGEATRAAIDRLVAAIGPPDLLIANAGVGLPCTGARFDAEAFDQMTRVNLMGVGHAIGAVLPGMIDRRRGHLVGISSLAGFRGLPGSAGYSATKAGLTTLLEGLRPELRPYGVAVTTVHPGFVRTEMTAESGHAMPFTMDADRAARTILRGIARRSRRVDFPWPTVALLRLVQALPGWAFDRIAPRVLGVDRPESRRDEVP